MAEFTDEHKQELTEEEAEFQKTQAELYAILEENDVKLNNKGE